MTRPDQPDTMTGAPYAPWPTVLTGALDGVHTSWAVL